MKQEVSPVVAVVVILAVLSIAAFSWYRVAGVSKDKNPPPTMPPEVAKQWAQYTKGAAPGAGSGGSIPTGQAGPTATPPRGGSFGAPPGVTGGYGR